MARWAKLLLVFTLYASSGFIGIHFAAIGDSSLTLIWLPSGIALGACLLFGRSIWPAIWLGSFAANTPFLVEPSSAWPYAQAVMVGALAATINSHVQGLFAHSLYQRYMSSEGLFRVKNILRFAGPVIVFPSLCNMALLVSVYGAFGYFDMKPVSLVHSFVSGFLADYHGYFVIAPLVAVYAQLRGSNDKCFVFNAQKLAYSLGLMALLTLGLLHFYPGIYLLLPFGVFVALRLGLLCACLYTLVLSLVFSFATSAGIGPFVTENAWQSLVALLIFIVSVGLPIMVVASEDFERRQVIDHFEDALAERTESLMTANHKLEQATRLDGLTGAANRSYFDNFLLKQWRRGMRNKKPLALLMIDVDHFKHYNDRHGHLAGDQCLRLIAQTLMAQLKRPSDLLARYGGEEFVVVLPDTDTPEDLAEACRKAVEQTLADPELPEAVTISIGCAKLVPRGNLSVISLIEWADKALYRAKREGRNRVLSHQAAS